MKSVKFLSELRLTNDPWNDEDWVLVADFLCECDGERINIRKGFHTDLASTPWLVRSFFPPYGRWDEAAVLHDYFYRIGGAASRAEADAAFLLGCLECGVPAWRSWCMYYAVRLFGGSSYKANSHART